MVKDEILVAKALVMDNESSDHRMKRLELISKWRIGGNKMVAVKHHALIDTFG